MRRVLFIALLLAALVCASSAAGAFRSPTPSAAEFGRDFVGTANAYAKAHGRAARLTNPDCVSPLPGRYMCSYGIARPGKAIECHVMQASWVAEGPSTIKITLSGRTQRCENLRAALRSLS
jgi:hypothetical protein